MRFERITVKTGQMGGQPCIRGLRIPVATVVAMVADGMTADEVVDALPDLELQTWLRPCTTPPPRSRSAWFRCSIPLEVLHRPVPVVTVGRWPCRGWT